MLHRDFALIYTTARKAGFITRVFSNGIILTPQARAAFEEILPHEVEITLYGISPDAIRNTTRRTPQLQKMIDNVRYYQSLGTPVHLKYHALTTTRDDTGAFIELADHLGCTHAVNVQIIPMRNGDRSVLEYRLDGATVREMEAEHGLDFTGEKSNPEELRSCRLGEDIYVTAEARLQGCPIFVGVTKELIPTNVSQQVYNIARAGEEIQKARSANGGVCPAWLHLEGAATINRFLEEMKTEAPAPGSPLAEYRAVRR